MPEVDGFELVATVRQDPALQSTPVIMLSSAGQAEAGASYEQLGVNAYLLKPVTFRPERHQDQPYQRARHR